MTTHISKQKDLLHKNASIAGWHFTLGLYRMKEGSCADGDGLFHRDDEAGMIAFWPLMQIKLDLLPSF